MHVSLYKPGYNFQNMKYRFEIGEIQRIYFPTPVLVITLECRTGTCG